MKKILALCIFLMLSLVAHAAEKSVWVEINGEAYMGEIETQKEVKDIPLGHNDRGKGRMAALMLPAF